MRIKWIKFKNLDTGLKINRTCFLENTTLLVGKSGAGKTQILESVETMCSIASGKNFKQFNVEGTICFSFENYEYIWHVKTEPSVSHSSSQDFNSVSDVLEKQMTIIGEFLAFRIIDNSYGEKINYSNFVKNERYNEFYTIFNRTDKNIFFQGYSETPMVNRYVSLINLYNENDLIKDVYKCFNQIYEILIPSNTYIPINYLNIVNKYNQILKDCNSIEEYREYFPSNFPVAAKLHLLKNTNQNLYDEMLNIYQGIFPEIKGFEVKIDKDVDDFVSIYFSIGDKLISIDYISMGMTKAFIFLLDLLTISNNYVVIIDEIENGLGINCIDDVYSLITSMREDLQFIITSHHPYIINQINPKICKIVNRKNNIVSTYLANDLGITNSHFDFYDLVMNKLEFGDI